ncbi:hypothetical protein EG329_004292 [Mollisiaceae sp. DMI_Dod_QoI]|nr:hypothetical protein EG329_004292 [Helotiales sp. DMI_Dod_QoI]
MTSSFHSLSKFGFGKYRYVTHGIEKIDINGYKFLERPLRIEYCDITERWMFSSEIRCRKVIAPMCKNVNCMARDMNLCEKTVDMELFCLDDAESWVIIGKAKYRAIPKIWRPYVGESGRLYCVDEKTECIRRQTFEEVKASRLRLTREKGSFMMDDDEASYMPVVRYLEAKR